MSVVVNSPNITTISAGYRNGLYPTLATAMLSLSDIRLKGIATHYAGNKAAGDDLRLSKTLSTVEEGARSMLLQYLLQPFQETASFHFWHPSDIALHELHHFITAIFNNPDDLLKQSCNIARHLHDVTNLPHIKSGEVHIALFSGCPVDGKMVDAVGIYKTDSRDAFLKLEQEGKAFIFLPEEGINPAKLDKGCLIFNVQAEEGYRVHVVDKTNKGGEAQFWKDSFLKVRAAADEYHATQDYMKLCKDFIVEAIPQEYEVSRVEQIDFLNRTAGYFKKNEQFSKQDFEEQVFAQPELIESFRRYEKTFGEDYELNLPDSFSISDSAVKKGARVFKSVLKLDKNFHVYVHGDRDLIEKGYDETTGMHFYKIYFKEEA